MFGTASFGDANRPRATKGRWGQTAGNGVQVGACLCTADTQTLEGTQAECQRPLESEEVVWKELQKVYKAVRLYVVTLDRPACA